MRHPKQDTPREILHALHTINTNLERLVMALNAQAQEIVDSINNTTNVIGEAITSAVTAITDLANKVTAGTIDPAELKAAIQPALDTLTAGAAALKKTATDADPALTPTAPPLTVPPLPPPTA